MAMVPWRGIGCCLSSAALYLLGRITRRDIEILSSVHRVNQLRELAQLLEEEISPLVVAISGRVGSKTPITCELSELRVVIVEVIEERLFLKHNDAGSWIQESASVSTGRKEVPWYLEDGTDRVHVVGARGATGFVLPAEGEAFKESGRSLARGTLDYLHGLKMLGEKKIERVLPIGTSLTVVGEAAKDDVGTIRVQRPSKGPFYVSPKTIDELIANLGRRARWYKCASAGLTVLGVFMIANHAVRYIMERRRRNELEKRVLTAAAAKISGQDNGGEMDDSLSDGAKRERAMPNLCVICLEKEYNSVFVPCGHMCCCTACSSHLTSCPLCRKQIEKAVKTFRH